MERAISQEERIRRAEEVYNKRRQEYYKNNKRYISNDESERKGISIKSRMKKKLFIQIFICLFIYFSLYTLLNSNYYFSDNIQKKIKEYMAYDINWQELFNAANTYIRSDKNFLKKFFINHKSEGNTNESDSISKENIKEQTQQESVIDSDKNKDLENTILNVDLEAIGGADTEEIVIDNRTQEEIDADYIKKNYEIIWPVNGVITSKYGARTPTDIVTANHYGLDIGANIGTEIVAAIDGVVTLTSSYGDYGNHLQIENGDVSTLYAHCSKLCVSDGDSVFKGQKIAEVGQTRKSYRATFAF